MSKEMDRETIRRSIEAAAERAAEEMPLEEDTLQPQPEPSPPSADPSPPRDASKWRVIAIFAITITLLVVLAIAWSAATYLPVRTEKWRKGDRLYVIKKNLWDTPLEEWVIYDDGDFLHGPLTESRKWHGKWTQYVGPKNDSSVFYHWYWYGEEITEGKWHELNR